MAITIKDKTYEVRELTFDDASLLSQILDKTNFSLKDFNKDVKGKRLTEDQVKQMAVSVAAEMVGHIVKNYHKAHKEAKQLLADLIGVKPEEFAKMPLTTPLLIVKELSKTVDLKDFFKSVAG